MKSLLSQNKIKLVASLVACMFAGITLHAQVNIVKAEYFIDTDPGFDKANTISVTAAANISDKSTNIPIDNVASGFHYLFLRSKDSNGKWSITNNLAFYKTNTTTAALANINKSEYFIDTDPGFGNAADIPVTASTNITDKSFLIPLGNVADGFHNLYLRSRDLNGKWSITNKLPFFKTKITGDPLLNVASAEYLIDTDPGFGKATAIPLTAATNVADKSVLISLANVTDGFHNLFVRSRDVNGKWSVSNKLSFFKVRTTTDAIPNVVKSEYFIDTDPGFGKATNITITAGADVAEKSTLIPISGVSNGFHILWVRSQDNNGRWSVTNKLPFFKVAATGEALPNIVAAEYFFDTDPGFGKGQPLAIGAANNIADYYSQVNITNLSVGNHLLYLRSKDTKGSWSITNIITVPISAAVAGPYITINGFSSRDLCSDHKFTVSIDATGTYNSGNIFSVQLSNSSGSFSSPLVIGSVTSVADSIITCTLPVHMTNSSQYKIRVVSSNPVVTGVASDSLLTILDQPRFKDTSITVICSTDKVNLTTLYNTGTYLVEWSLPDPTAASIGTNSMYTSTQGKCRDTANIFIKQDIATWTGATSNNWHTATNWNNGKVPSTTTHVIIPAGTANICVLSASDVTISSVQVRPGGVMNVINNRQVNITAKCSSLPAN